VTDGSRKGQGAEDAKGGKSGGAGRDGKPGGRPQRGQGHKDNGDGRPDRANGGGKGGGQGGGGKRAARDRLSAEREQQAKADRRKRQSSNAVIAVVVLVVVALIIFFAWRASTDDGPQNAALPSLVTEQGGGVVFGDGPVEIDLWEDFQCPGCKAFEETYGELLKERVDAGDVTMTVHPLSFLDNNLGNTSSTLAANAFGCATDAGEQQALDFHLTVYANQPAEVPGQEAWSADDLIGWGNDVGIEGTEWESCVNDQPYAGWVEQVAATQGDAGITSTPTVFIDGEEFELGQDLDAAIDEALGAN
jgi:protein-disulfide isomerase